MLLLPLRLLLPLKKPQGLQLSNRPVRRLKQEPELKQPELLLSRELLLSKLLGRGLLQSKLLGRGLLQSKLQEKELLLPPLQQLLLSLQLGLFTILSIRLLTMKPRLTSPSLRPEMETA